MQTGRKTADAAMLRDFVAEALAQDRAALALQPVVEAGRPDRAAFHEGLIRLIDPEGKPVAAGVFIGAVEGSALGRALDRTALELGLAALAEDPGLRLSLNVSPRSIGDARWHRILRAGLAEDVTLAERLILEITESSAISRADEVAGFVREMQRAGLSVALDDFGAGYTSFRHFREIRFDILKIDGRFTRDIDADPDNRALVMAMRDVARHFEMLTVAECVETAAEAACLAELGVDAMQGYHFGRPALRLPAPAEPVRRRA